MEIITRQLSKDKKRQKAYTLWLENCLTEGATLGDIVQMGYRLMRKARLHHHFFNNGSLFKTAEYLANHALQCRLPEAVRLDNHYRLNEQEAICIIQLFEKRIAEKLPVPYITNTGEYCGRQFFVNKHVLVPRSIMSNRFQDFLDNIEWKNHRILDLCTGSGCIGITLALMSKNVRVDLSDISQEALAVAQLNIKRHGLEDRVQCIHSNLFEQITGPYDLIITNPPYVSTKEYQQVPAEFKHEPKIALESGKDGLDIINKILAQAKQYLNSNGVLIAEVGYTAAKTLKRKYPQVNFQWLTYRRPDGTEAWLAMDGIFLCKKTDLPDPDALKNATTRSIFARLFT
ncbi:MAG: hypothetical protein RLZ35_714 [Pseudomonadota bacterium]|jgi:ribosomal protein L3 glutamine methyltransferase